MNTVELRKFISKLNRDTKEDHINWNKSIKAPQTLIGSETLLDFVYTANVLGRYVRLFKFKQKYFYDEDVFDWAENYRLELVDINGNSLFTFPDDLLIPDLYDTVRFKTSDVSTFFNDYLTDDND